MPQGDLVTGQVVLAAEVADALADGGPVVALESTLLAHGLPPGRNREVAEWLESAVRAEGAVPATIAVLGGQARIGLGPGELDRVCDRSTGLVKLSSRDLGPAMALGRDGATTVAATAALAHQAGIRVFATGGLGGVHRGEVPGGVTWDVSADLDVLAHTPLLVVCSGVKSILDIGATVEVLETRSIPVVGYRTSSFPAFYRRASPFGLTWRVDNAAQVAAVADTHFRHAPACSAILLVNPVPVEHEMPLELHDRLLADGMAMLRQRDVRGQEVTPALLEHFHRESGGASLAANEALVLDNAALAARVAAVLTPRG